jgi:hypothetical protein
MSLQLEHAILIKDSCSLYLILNSLSKCYHVNVVIVLADCNASTTAFEICTCERNN